METLPLKSTFGIPYCQAFPQHGAAHGWPRVPVFRIHPSVNVAILPQGRSMPSEGMEISRAWRPKAARSWPAKVTRYPKPARHLRPLSDQGGSAVAAQLYGQCACRGGSIGPHVASLGSRRAPERAGMLSAASMRPTGSCWCSGAPHSAPPGSAARSNTGRCDQPGNAVPDGETGVSFHDGCDRGIKTTPRRGLDVSPTALDFATASEPRSGALCRLFRRRARRRRQESKSVST